VNESSSPDTRRPRALVDWDAYDATTVVPSLLGMDQPATPSHLRAYSLATDWSHSLATALESPRRNMPTGPTWPTAAPQRSRPATAEQPRHSTSREGTPAPDSPASSKPSKSPRFAISRTVTSGTPVVATRTLPVPPASANAPQRTLGLGLGVGAPRSRSPSVSPSMGNLGPGTDLPDDLTPLPVAAIQNPYVAALKGSLATGNGSPTRGPLTRVVSVQPHHQSPSITHMRMPSFVMRAKEEENAAEKEDSRIGLKSHTQAAPHGIASIRQEREVHADVTTSSMHRSRKAPLKANANTATATASAAAGSTNPLATLQAADTEFQSLFSQRKGAAHDRALRGVRVIEDPSLVRGLSPALSDALKSNPLLWSDPLMAQQYSDQVFAHYTSHLREYFVGREPKNQYMDGASLHRLASDSVDRFLQMYRETLRKTNRKFDEDAIERALRKELPHTPMCQGVKPVKLPPSMRAASTKSAAVAQSHESEAEINVSVDESPPSSEPAPSSGYHASAAAPASSSSTAAAGSTSATSPWQCCGSFSSLFAETYIPLPLLKSHIASLLRRELDKDRDGKVSRTDFNMRWQPTVRRLMNVEPPQKDLCVIL
jgi:hypothetical protein